MLSLSAKARAGLVPSNQLHESTLSLEQKNQLLCDILFAIGYAEYKIQYLGDELCDDLANTQPNVIYVENTEHDDVKRLSVKKDYATKFHNTYVTAEDLDLSRLPNSQSECDSEVAEKIEQLAVKRGLANHGFHGQDLGKIADTKDLYCAIAVIYVLVSAALVTEFGFGGLQFYYGRTGLVTLLNILKIVGIAAQWLSTGLSSFGSTLDLNVNLKSVSPANDALEAATLNANTGSQLIDIAMTINLVFSLIAYTAGATGNVRGVLKLLLPDNDCPGVDTCMDARYGSLVLAIITILAGSSYYLVFGNSARKKAFEEFARYLKSPKADHNFWRNSQIIIQIMSNIAFRSPLLASTTIGTIPYFVSMSDSSKQTTSMIVTAGVAQDILTSRGVRTVQAWSHPDWAYVTEEEVAAALKNMTWKKTFSAVETACTLIMAGGAACFAGFSNILTVKIVASIAAAAIILVNFMAQRNRSAVTLVAASEKFQEELPDRKLAAQRAYSSLQLENKESVTSPLMQNEIGTDNAIKVLKPTSHNETPNEVRNKRLATGQLMCAALGDAIGAKLSTFDKASIAGSLFIRGAVELTSTDVLVDIWRLKLSDYELLSVVLILIPATLSNFGLMCYKNIDSIAKQKGAETYLVYRKATSNIPENEAPDFSTWKAANKMTVFAQTYRNGLDSYTAKELKDALVERAEKLGHSFTPA